jgi:hypothetical protein
MTPPEHHDSPEEELAEDHAEKEAQVLEREGLETEMMEHDDSEAGEQVGDVQDIETSTD